MTERAGLEVDTLTIRIPMRLQRRGGRKLIMTPEGVAAPAPKPRRDETLVKALVRAHRWRRRIESGQAKSITDLAEQEGVTDAYVCRLLPLTCLAPDIVEAILDGRQPKGLRLAEMLGNGPLAWEEQRARWELRLSDYSAAVLVRASTPPKLLALRAATWLSGLRGIPIFLHGQVVIRHRNRWSVGWRVSSMHADLKFRAIWAQRGRRYLPLIGSLRHHRQRFRSHRRFLLRSRLQTESRPKTCRRRALPLVDGL